MSEQLVPQVCEALDGGLEQVGRRVGFAQDLGAMIPNQFSTKLSQNRGRACSE